MTSIGDLLGFPKSAVVNFAVRRVRKMVPPYSLPGHLQFTEVLEEGHGLTLERVTLEPEEIAFLQYTGGTTGVAKGAVLTHRNLIANLLQSEAWLEPALHDTRRGPVPEQFVYVCALPLYHAFALVANCLFGMRVGALNVLIANPRDIHQMVKDLRRHPFNVLPAVNTLLNAMAENARVPQARLLRSADLVRRRHGGAQGGGRQMARADRLSGRRGLRVDRDLAGGDL